MTRTTLGATALLLASTVLAQAGALDRTLTPIGIIFEDGNYAELSYGFTSPSVTGSVAGGAVSSGQAGVDYSQVALSFKYDVSEALSVAVIVDQPFGADVNYDESGPGYPVGGSSADFRSSGVTVLGRYKLNDAFSVHGGARYVTTDADLYVTAPAAPGVTVAYDAQYGSDSDTSYIVGGAYERPEIALRVALTYASETRFANEATYSTSFNGGPAPTATDRLDYTLPQTLTLDFRTGIAANTLLFGSVRWSDWSETEIVSPGYFANPVVDYENDIYTTTLGVGRKFTDQISAAASVIYETKASSDFDPAAPNTGASNLAPYDGQLGLQLAGTYLVGNGLELSGGVRYSMLGDVTTRAIAAEFADNHAVSVGLRIGYRF